MSKKQDKTRKDGDVSSLSKSNSVAKGDLIGDTKQNINNPTNFSMVEIPMKMYVESHKYESDFLKTRDEMILVNFVTSDTKTTYELGILQTDKVGKVKRRISDLLKINRDKIKLMIGKESIDDDLPISIFEITDGGTIFLNIENQKSNNIMSKPTQNKSDKNAKVFTSDDDSDSEDDVRFSNLIKSMKQTEANDSETENDASTKSDNSNKTTDVSTKSDNSNKTTDASTKSDNSNKTTDKTGDSNKTPIEISTKKKKSSS